MQMLRKFLILIFLVLFFTVPNFCSAGLMDHPTVAVIPFVNQAADHSFSVSNGILEDVRSITETDIQNTMMFEMVDRINIDRLIDEHKFSRSGLVDPNTAAKLGKMLGAHYLILGTVTNIARDRGKMKANVTLRMVSVETASVALSGRGKGEASSVSDALEKATEDALDGKRGILTMIIGKR